MSSYEDCFMKLKWKESEFLQLASAPVDVLKA